jgi:hypothetical protein
MTRELPQGYQLVEGPPPVGAYLTLRRDSGLSPKTRKQAVAALPGSWYACHGFVDTAPISRGMALRLG